MRLRHNAATAMLRRLYHRVLRRTALRTVRLDSFMTFTGFSYGKHGWHHLIRLLDQVERDPTLASDQSVLFRFHERYQPKGMYELVRHRDDGISFKPPLGIFPWGSFRLGFGLDWHLEQKSWEESRFCGPTPPARVNAEFKSFLSLFRDFQKHGYQPWRYGFVGGTLLERLDGSTRFVVLQGNHRAAILSHLGFDSILVSPVQGRHTVINERDVSSWHYVNTGQCSESDALAYFNAFFELTGLEQAERFGLVTPDSE